MIGSSNVSGNGLPCQPGLLLGLLKFDFKAAAQPGLQQNQLWEEIISREVKLVNWVEGGLQSRGREGGSPGHGNLQKVVLSRC